MPKLTKTALRDVAERTLFTFLEAFLGILVVADAIDVTALQAAGAAGLAAALAVLKGFAATQIGKQGASLDPDLATIDTSALPRATKRAAKKITGDSGQAGGDVLWTVFLILGIVALVIWIWARTH